MAKTTTKMELVSIDKLIPYVNNARTHSAEQVNKIRSGLREFGFVNPTMASSQDMAESLLRRRRALMKYHVFW